MKKKKTIKDILSGMLMGVACAIPGVSGGTMAIMLGVYDRHLDHMDGLRKNFIKNLIPLLPLAAGVILGVIPAVILFNLAFEGFVFGIVSLFAGLILGGIPGLCDEIKNKPITKGNIITLIITLLIAVGFGLMSMLLKENINLLGNFNMTIEGDWIINGHVSWWIYLLLIPIGVIAALSLIVPGISGSMLLLVLGFYTPLLKTVNWWKDLLTGNGNIEQFFSVAGIYLCLLIGIIVGFFTIVKIMKILFAKYKLITYYGIIGFVIGSLVSLYINGDIMAYYNNWANPTFKTWMPMWAEILVGIILLIIGTGLSYYMVIYSRKHKDENVAE